MSYRLLKKTGGLLARGWTKWFGVRPLKQSQSTIGHWFSAPLGQRILTAEQYALDQIMPKMYGYHLMQLSVLNGVHLSRQSPITHHFPLGLSNTSGAPAVTHFEQLPIDAESIDTAILHHVLEYSTHPHQLLRETARTIIPNGYIVVVGFNPMSSLAMKKQVGRLFTTAAQWRYHDLRRSRVVDWLRVLDFEPVSIEYGYHGMPFSRGYRQGVDRFFGKIAPITGAFYVIVARKSVIPMTLIKKPWSKKSSLPVWAKGSAVPREPVLHQQNQKKSLS